MKESNVPSVPREECHVVKHQCVRETKGLTPSQSGRDTSLRKYIHHATAKTNFRTLLCYGNQINTTTYKKCVNKFQFYIFCQKRNYKKNQQYNVMNNANFFCNNISQIALMGTIFSRKVQ